ncbi:MAG: IS66 family transposase [Nitrospirota bacterium]|nr:IS66 family transposase [Nitrospirota bacterium]
MNSDVANLPDNPEVLKEIIVNFNTEVSLLQEQVRLLKDLLYGRKTEKREEANGEQGSLFDEAEEVEEEVREKEISIPAHTRKTGRKPLPKELPREEIIHDLREEEKQCGCGSRLSRIGEEVSEKLDIVPAKVKVIRHIRYKYACRSCEGLESEEGAVKTAKLPAQIIPQGIVTPGLLSHILISKFADAMPFYRQEKKFRRIGVEISRATMSNWAIQVGKRCKPLISLLREEIIKGPVVNIDETTVQVMKEPGRANKSKSYMWVFLGGVRGRPGVIYQYHPGRYGDVAKEFLADYRGYAQTDGYSGYNFFDENPEIEHVGCWAHARRKFVDVTRAMKKGKTGSANVALSYIGKLYQIEAEAADADMGAEEVYELRQKKAMPVLEEFKQWLDKRMQYTPPRGLLGKAIGYTVKRWDNLVRYLDDGRLRPDNNIAENAIRPFVVGRKNWLFSGHPRGAEASAAIYSLIETAKANGLEPYAYLRFLFEELPGANTEEDYRALLPQYVNRGSIVLLG